MDTPRQTITANTAPWYRPQTAKQLAFHDAMRKLWEQHVTWTRLAIVSFAGDLPDLPVTEQRLLADQTDIGNAVKPFYGQAAGQKLTKLLKAHITGAVAILEAAKAGDTTQLAHAKAAWYANANQISDFLSAANPRNWPDASVRAMMKTHLDQTLSEAIISSPATIEPAFTSTTRSAPHPRNGRHPLERNRQAIPESLPLERRTAPEPGDRACRSPGPGVR